MSVAFVGGPVMPVDPEAADVLRREAVYFPSDDSPPATVAEFKPYLRKLDPFADYLTPQEYLSFKKVQEENYAGIALDLERDVHGEVVCYPDRDGPAARAGVVAGDRLLSLDAHGVEGWALPSLVALAAGSPGSVLVIEVSRGKAERKHFSIVRTQKAGPSVSQRRVHGRVLIRIASFTPNTRQELGFELSRVRPTERLIIDLRGNRGGDLNAAIDCAMLFLNPGESVGSVRRKDGVHAYRSSVAGEWHSRTALLWQDAETASAAEVFIAALTENRRAISVGTRTFGKGSEQGLIVLGTGAALIVTTGYLTTPGGREIDGLGLEPRRAAPIEGEPVAWH